jgi:hypothetical protein
LRTQIEPGDILICIDEDREDADFGVSGLVFPGNKSLHLEREYEILSIDETNVPADSKKETVWYDNSIEEFHKIQDYWVLVDLKDLKTGKTLKREWLHNFKKK